MAELNDNAMSTAMGTFHLSTGSHRAAQPAKRNFFEFVLEDGDGTFDRLLKPGASSDSTDLNDYITNSTEVIIGLIVLTFVERFDPATN